MKYCNECEAVVEVVSIPDEDEVEYTACADCGSDDVQIIPEHDDHDMER